MPLKLAVFDYDLTLSRHHMFYCLSGSDKATLRVPGPYPRTERGQLAKIAQLEQLPMIRQQGGFAMALFGGEQRVRELHAFFQELAQGGVEMWVCSKSLLGPLQYCLHQVGLRHFFARCYGNVGEIYGRVTADTPELLRSLPQSFEQFLGDPSMGRWGSKAKLMSVVTSEMRLQPDEAVFVDDMREEVRSCQGICQAVWVNPPQGLTMQNYQDLRSMMVRGARDHMQASSSLPSSSFTVAHYTYHDDDVDPKLAQMHDHFLEVDPTLDEDDVNVPCAWIGAGHSEEVYHTDSDHKWGKEESNECVVM